MTLVKICGITNEADMVAAIAAGADLLGFVLYEKSPRAVTPEQVARLTAHIRQMEAPRIPLCVGVFVSPAAEYVMDILDTCGLQAAQVHQPDWVALAGLSDRARGAVYPAVQVFPSSAERGGAGLAQLGASDVQIAPWLPQLLLDAYHPTLHGGTGQRVDVQLARAVAGRFERLMLAGGLTPDNVAETIRAVRPWAVDVSSGIEAVPGRKDHGKIRAFIQAVRTVDEELG
jgi:phosphoribosylanthranilate isomerase